MPGEHTHPIHTATERGLKLVTETCAAFYDYKSWDDFNPNLETKVDYIRTWGVDIVGRSSTSATLLRWSVGYFL